MQGKLNAQARRITWACRSRKYLWSMSSLEFSGVTLSQKVVSGILMAVRRGTFFLLFVLNLVSARTVQARRQAVPAPQGAALQPAPQPAQQAFPPAAPPHKTLAVVVLDPAHG